MYWLLVFLSLPSWAARPVLQVDLKAMESLAGRPAYQSHSDWVGIPLPFAPVEELRLALEKQLGKKLQHRGEAQITVITPSEWRVISQVLKMNTLDKLVTELKASEAKIKVKCLKKVSVMLAGRSEESWVVSLEAPELYELRQKIWRRFLANGGISHEFPWKRWAPHVTVGFTAQDLHDEDRVSKDRSDCSFELKSRE